MIGPRGIVIVFASLVMVIAFLYEGLRKRGKQNNLYQRKDLLFTDTERSFLGILEQAIGDQGRVFGMVCIADVLEPRSKLSNNERTSALNRISNKSFDFVICNPKTMAIICAIELNDKSHSKKNRKERDEFLASVCESVELPLVMITCSQSYSISEIRESVLPYISDVHANNPDNKVETTSIRPSEQIEELHPNQRLCPKCHSPLVERISKKGSHAGTKFMACSSYPRCRYLEAILPTK